MQSAEIRARFLRFFEKRGHTVLPSASLVPENDPSVLFTTAGMQPLVPYLLGETHPAGKRLVNVQKCVRTQDIEEVGDKTHDTFFEMLGNWSLGDYFKHEAITWSYELITSTTEGWGMDPKRLYITVFAGDETAPRDEESVRIWTMLGVPAHRIYYLGKDKNWWSPGDNGPCGPDTEMYYDVTPKGLGDLTHEEFVAADVQQHVVEFWNDVFMEYEKKDGRVVGKLQKQNVDTGAGVERLAMILQKKDTVFETDLFAPIMTKIEEFSKPVREDASLLHSQRIVADHIRTAVFMITDGVFPSNTDRGYVLRRIIRRAVRYADELGMKHGSLFWIAGTVPEIYGSVYPELALSIEHVKKVIDTEEHAFRETLTRGMRIIEKIPGTISGKDAFLLFTTYGFPVEMTEEIARGRGVQVDRVSYEEELLQHKELSRKGSEKKFKGGLADHSDQSVKYHTATHLLHKALRDVLGSHVIQRGSNITPERLRFDFTHPTKMTDEEKKRVENLVNEIIEKDLPVTWEEISVVEAKRRGAIGVFEDKYADTVKVYHVGTTEDTFSYEICGGPHVMHTGVIGHFTLVKEEAVAAGIRRIKAVID